MGPPFQWERIVHMTRTIKVLVLLVVILVGTIAALLFSGRAIYVAAWFTKPSHGWDLALKAPAPDYAIADSWAARPGKDSFALFVPSMSSSFTRRVF
jgi:hypothetical protein